MNTGHFKSINIIRESIHLNSNPRCSTIFMEWFSAMFTIGNMSENTFCLYEFNTLHSTEKRNPIFHVSHCLTYFTYHNDSNVCGSLSVFVCLGLIVCFSDSLCVSMCVCDSQVLCVCLSLPVPMSLCVSVCVASLSVCTSVSLSVCVSECVCVSVSVCMSLLWT